MDKLFEDFGAQYVPPNYLALSSDAKKNCLKQYRALLEKKKIPATGWKDFEVEEFINYIASMDSNNFRSTSGIGEREGRIACQLVARRHYHFSHGIGRSGDLLESQPKAAGSSLLSTLTNALILDYIRNISGIHGTAQCFVVPVATGMALSLCFLSLRKQKPQAKYIIWSRIDQKSAFKAITTSGLSPIIIEQKLNEAGELSTDLEEFENQIQIIGTDQILCLYSTTSCFAPRTPDNLKELAALAKKYELHHVVNNAYGLQSSQISHKIEEARKIGRIDLFVQSTDKNFLVPVGGAIVAGFDADTVQNVAKTYAGRATSSQSLDVMLTLLSLGGDGLKQQYADRRSNFDYLYERIKELAEKIEENVIACKNPISIAMTISNLDENKQTELGSMLFKRGVTGARVITCIDSKEIDGHKFECWGSHLSEHNPCDPYITAAAALGIRRSEIDSFCKKLEECYQSLKD